MSWRAAEHCEAAWIYKQECRFVFRFLLNTQTGGGTSGSVCYRFILEFQPKDRVSFFVVFDDLCSLPNVLRVRDPDPSVLKHMKKKHLSANVSLLSVSVWTSALHEGGDDWTEARSSALNMVTCLGQTNVRTSSVNVWLKQCVYVSVEDMNLLKDKLTDPELRKTEFEKSEKMAEG